MGLTVKDKCYIKGCQWLKNVNKWLIGMYCDRRRNVEMLETLIGENDNSCSIDSRQHSDRRHTTQLWISTVKDRALILLKVTIAH